MKLCSSVTVITLIRQDDVPSRKTKQKCDAKHFLSRYLTQLKGSSRRSSQFNLRDSFFLLGRSSMALLLTCQTLSQIPELIRFLVSIQGQLREEGGLELGLFEPYCFPAIELSRQSTSGQPKKDNIIPALVFVRTPKDLNTLIPRITTDAQTMEQVHGIFLGFGVYDLILHMQFKTLCQLRDGINSLRKQIGTFWETSTIIGVPNQKRVERRIALSENATEIPFSISAKCMGGSDVDVASGMLRLSKRKRFRHLFCTHSNRSKVLNSRQGYMDVEAHVWSKTVSGVFDFSCAVRGLDGVIDTCTVVQLPFG